MVQDWNVKHPQIRIELDKILRNKIIKGEISDNSKEALAVDKQAREIAIIFFVCVALLATGFNLLTFENGLNNICCYLGIANIFYSLILSLRILFLLYGV